MKKPYRLKKRGGVYYYKLPEMSTFRTTGETKPQRAEFFAHNESLKATADPQEPRDRAAVTQAPLLGDYARDFFVPGKCPWLAWRAGSSTLPGAHYTEALRRYLVEAILPDWGGYRLDAIKRRDVKPWILNRTEGSAWKNHALNAFRIILDQAEEDEWIDKNPIAGIGRLKGGEHPPDPLEISELHQLYPDDVVRMIAIWNSLKWAVFFVVLAGTGMRQGEVRALRWRHVLWTMGALLVESAAKKVRKDDPNKIGSTKAKKARIVVLSDRVLTELSVYRYLADSSAPEDLIFPGAYNPKVPLAGETVSFRFSEALSCAGIEAGGRRLVPHSLRHTCVAHLRREIGEDALRLMVGHSFAAITDIYDDPKVVRSVAALEPARKSMGALLPAAPELQE